MGVTGNDDIADRLRQLAFEPDEAQSRAALIADACAVFQRITAVHPRWSWFIPGRIEIFGKHTDYAGGRSLVAAVPRGFAVVAAPRGDRRVRTIDARWRDSMEISPTDAHSKFAGWSNYVAVVARRFADNFPGADFGADIAVLSDLPRAAGLSSSSALVVGIATALAERAGLRDRPEWQAAIGNTLDLAGYLGAVENGMTFKTLRGTSGVGTHGGSEDHTAILSGVADHVSAYAYVPVRHLGDDPMPTDWRFVVAASGIQADKAGGAKERYNRASLGTRALLELANASCGTSWPTLAALLASSPDASGHLRELATSNGMSGFSPAELTTRLTHFVAEDGRVPLAAAAFGRADEQALGDLSSASQTQADALLNNQTPETRSLAELARGQGAFASSSFGAGFGGSVWALVRRDDAEAFAARWLAAYRSAFPAVTRAEVFVTRPGPGVVSVPVT